MENAGVTIYFFGGGGAFRHHHSFACLSISETILQRLMDQLLSGDFSFNKTLWLERN